MPLVVMCGLPCSGKTRFAEALVARMKEEMEDDERVLIVDETMLHVDKGRGYADPSMEKATRGTLKAKVERELSKKTYFVLDSMNAIKGYRYELWCIARAAGTRYCVVYADVDVDIARGWNANRQDTPFCEAVFEDLARRFEVPDSKNRWETPLFRISADWNGMEQMVEDVMLAMKGKPRLKAPQAVELKPTVATFARNPRATNLLNDVDKEVQSVVMEISDAQSEISGQPIGLLRVRDVPTPLNLTRPVALSELRMQKRIFLRLLAQASGAPTDASTARRMFVEYLRTNIH